MIYSKAEAAQLGLRDPVYNEDVLPLVRQGTRVQISDIFGKGFVLYSNSVQDFHDFKANKGLSTGDVTHSFAGEWLWELPKLQGWSAVPRALLGGWQLAGIFRAQSGAPIQVSEPSAISASRPDLIDPKAAVNQDYRQTLQYLNRDAFAVVPRSAVSGATLRPAT